MLTDKERKWLEKRKKRCERCTHYSPNIVWCQCIHNFKTDAYSLEPNYHDAAEFEARVAAKLAEHAGSCGRRGGSGTLLRPHGCSWYNADGYRETVCPPGHDIDKCAGIPCNLYLSRIAVEEEMDNDSAGVA